MTYVNPAMTPEDVAIIRRVHGYRLGPLVVHTDNERDIAAMAEREGRTYISDLAVAAAHHHSAAYIVNFVREARGAEMAREVAVSPLLIEFWDEKIADWETD